MAASFGSATFNEARQGDGYPAYNKKMLTLDRQVIGGDAQSTNIGLDVKTANVLANCTAAQYDALLGKQGDSDTLTIVWGSGSAYLDSMDAPKLAGPGADIYEVMLHFIWL